MRLNRTLQWLAVVIFALILPATAAASVNHTARASRTGVAHTAQLTHAARVSGTVYYVSPTGSDSNSGTSPKQAWQTVHQVDRAQLNPGDEVLFQGGATFSDDTLMPGWGTSASGIAGTPIIFASYGTGQATLPLGVWFDGDSHLAFENLTLGNSSGDTGNGFQGNGNDITIAGMTIEHVDLGINAEGNNWTIEHNTVAYTGDSGLLLGSSAGEPGDPAGGSHYLVTGNTISHLGLNAADTYGTHGIYDKVTNATITNNTITAFNNDAISVRYRDSVITNNTLSGGDIGIAWFQYDTTAGTSKWTNNTISNVTAAGIFVSSVKEGTRQTLESFQIHGNTITNVSPGADVMNLQPTTGTYTMN
jgi:Right handed beta helix region